MPVALWTALATAAPGPHMPSSPVLVDERAEALVDDILLVQRRRRSSVFAIDPVPTCTSSVGAPPGGYGRARRHQEVPAVIRQREPRSKHAATAELLICAARSGCRKSAALKRRGSSRH